MLGWVLLKQEGSLKVPRLDNGFMPLEGRGLRGG